MTSPHANGLLSGMASYVGAPVGRTCGGPGALTWFVAPDLRIIKAWGTVTPDTLRFLHAVTASERRPGFPPFASLVDVRELQAAEPEAFALGRTIGDVGGDAGGAGPWHQVAQRTAIVHAGGFGGIAAGAFLGYVTTLGWRIEVAIHDALAPALAWLGVGHDVGALDLGLTERRAACVAEASLVERARAWIASHLADASMTTCARGLGVATRTLQRHLMEEATTFRHLLQDARVARAKALLSESDLKVGAVALEVGYPKLQSLADAFRRATGMTPAEWRRAHRT